MFKACLKVMFMAYVPVKYNTLSSSTDYCELKILVRIILAIKTRLCNHYSTDDELTAVTKR